MKIYGIKTCDTCRKAMKLLQTVGQEVEFVDVRATPLAPEQLARFLAEFGEDLVNTRSTTWRGLNASERQAAPESLLSEHPTLMKRPVIEADALHLGWGKDVQSALL